MLQLVHDDGGSGDDGDWSLMMSYQKGYSHLLISALNESFRSHRL